MGVFTFTTPAKIIMIKENLTSQIDGTKQTFGLSRNAESGSVRVYWNGLRQIVGVTFSEVTPTTIYLDFIPQAGDYLSVEYIPS